MKKTNSINLKIKEMLECWGAKHIEVGSFSSMKKIGPKERQKLRYKLIESIKRHKDFTKYQKDFKEKPLLKIGGKPEGSITSLSISHTENRAVFLFTFENKLSIGFDIENKDRVTKKVIERVSSKEEICQTPGISLLWTAKEASFKCLSDRKNKLLLSDCFILQWKKEKEFYTFRCHSKKTGQIALGIAGSIKRLAFAYAESSIHPIKK